jgi:hypothetical protein
LGIAAHVGEERGYVHLARLDAVARTPGESIGEDVVESAAAS